MQMRRIHQPTPLQEQNLTVWGAVRPLPQPDSSIERKDPSPHPHPCVLGHSIPPQFLRWLAAPLTVSVKRRSGVRPAVCPIC